MVLETHVKLCVTQLDVMKILLLAKWGKYVFDLVKMGKIGFVDLFYNEMCIIVCIGISPPTPPPPLSYQALPLKSTTIQAPLFRQFLLLYWFFVSPLLKVGFFSEPPKY